MTWKLLIFGLPLSCWMLSTSVAAGNRATAWQEAIEHNAVETIAAGMSEVQDVNASTNNGKTALMAAARQGATPLAEALLAAGADVRATNRSGGTALMYAAWSGEVSTMRALLRAGAIVDRQSQNGWTALMMAAAKNRMAAARVLLGAGADADLPDVYGWTPLMRATHSGYLEMAGLLAEHSSLNVINDQGQTALHLAVIQGHASIAQILLERGCNAATVDFLGKSAKDIAVELDRPSLIRILNDPHNLVR